MSLIVYALLAMLVAYAAILWFVLARDRRARIRHKRDAATR